MRCSSCSGLAGSRSAGRPRPRVTSATGWPPAGTCSPATSRRGPSMTSWATTCGMTARVGVLCPGLLKRWLEIDLDPYGTSDLLWGHPREMVESTPGGPPGSFCRLPRSRCHRLHPARGGRAPLAPGRGARIPAGGVRAEVPPLLAGAQVPGPDYPDTLGPGPDRPAWRVTAGRSPIRNPNSAIPIGAPDA